MMRLAARIHDIKQVSQDSFENICYIKEVTESTTIGELIEWQKENCTPYHKLLNDGITIYQMYIGKME